MLPKNNMTGNTKTMRDRIIASVAFLFHSIPKKAIQPRTRLEFGVLMRLE
jgi:hypothetical protein